MQNFRGEESCLHVSKQKGKRAEKLRSVVYTEQYATNNRYEKLFAYVELANRRQVQKVGNCPDMNKENRNRYEKYRVVCVRARRKPEEDKS